MVRNKFKEMSIVDLKNLLSNNRIAITEDCIKKSLGNLKNTSNIRLLRRDNARILTILKGKNGKCV